MLRQIRTHRSVFRSAVLHTAVETILVFFAKKVSSSRADFDSEGTKSGADASPNRPIGAGKRFSSPPGASKNGLVHADSPGAKATQFLGEAEIDVCAPSADAT